MEFQKKVFIIVGAISLVIVLFLFSFFIFLYNPRFYDWQYQKNGVYDTFGYNQTWNATQELWGYMQSDKDFTSTFFSSRDKQHMIDVRNLILYTEYLLFFFSLVFLLVLLYYFTFDRTIFSYFMNSILFYSGILSFLVIIFLGIFAVFFEKSFLLFHKIFFTNDFWILNPATDKLILLFPESFFFTIFVFILGLSFVFTCLLFFLSWYLKKKMAKKHIN